MYRNVDNHNTKSLYAHKNLLCICSVYAPIANIQIILYELE
jgi:hypothetical protein